MPRSTAPSASSRTTMRAGWGLVALWTLAASTALASSEAVTGEDHDMTSILEGLGSLMKDKDNKGCHAAEEFEHYLPRNKTRAGKIRMLLEQHDGQNASSFSSLCVSKCCENPSECDYLWVFNRKCYSIKCHSPETCTPVEREGLNSTLIKMSTSFSSSVSTSELTPQTPSPTTHATTEPTHADTPSTEPPSPVGLSVSTTKDQYTVQLPKDSVKIFASVYPQPPKGTEYKWEWKLSEGPTSGTMEGSTEQTLILKHLVEGLYQIKVTVTGEDESVGEHSVNVTVLPAPHQNKPPEIHFGTSPNVTIRLPDNTYYLDASQSADDEEDPLHYHWELISRPVEAPPIEPSDKAVLSLKDLQEGVYEFKLTVTDSQGLSSSRSAYITVQAAKDDPPTADAGGSSHSIRLPQNEVTLYANNSKDDHGIVKYEWVQQNPADDEPINIEGVNGPFLHLSGLKKGGYQFKLTVTDAKGQTDSIPVSVVVEEESTNPPVARAGNNMVIHYPSHSVKLDGSNSTDDYKIEQYEWSLSSGPHDAVIQTADKPVTIVTGLRVHESSPTVYTFQLKVTNHRKLSSVATVNVTVYKDPVVPPVADAGPDVHIYLPQHLVCLNGSGSHDDFGIVQYKWNRSDDSPAAGAIEEGSDLMPILKLANLVEGTYNFTLCVTNSKSQSSCDVTQLRVHPEPNRAKIMQVVVDMPTTTFTTSMLNNLVVAIQLELERGQLDNVDVSVTDLYQLGPDTVVEFTVIHKDSGLLVNGTVVLEKLQQYLGGGELRGMTIKKFDTKVCLNDCSGHGTCNQRTKKCACNVFWMENFFKSNFGPRRSNCEWSVLYFVLVIAGVVFLFTFVFWCACCCHIRRRRVKRKKRIKYALLNNHDEDHEDRGVGHSMKASKRSGAKKGVMVMSSESEDDVLFKREGPTDTPPPGYTNTIGRQNSNNSSLVSGLIPQ